MEKLGLNWSSKRWSTFLIVTLPLLLVLTLLYQNSDIDIFGKFTDFKVLRGARGSGHGESVADELSSRSQNLTDKRKVQNSTDEVRLKEEPHNSTDAAIGGQAQNPTSHLSGNEAENNTQKIVGEKTMNVTESYAGSATDSSLDVAKNDKLLGGLLSPLFSQDSCLSRYQSYLLRRASPHKPSPYLIAKLRNYEKLHQKCGPHTAAYNRTMRRLMQSESIQGDTTCKYIVWTPDNGLGNRIINIASTFLYAVLRQNSTNSMNKSSPTFMLLTLQHGNNDQNRVFHCGYAQQIIQKSFVLVLESDQYFIPALFMIPAFSEELCKMFTDKETIFHHVGRYLFHPSDETWGIISRFYQAYLAKADEIIGIQIRVFEKSSKLQYVMDRVLACAINNKILPELEKKEMVTFPTRNQTLKAVLVTSLKPDYSEKLRSMYSMKPTVTRDVVGVFQPSDEQEQKFSDGKHNIKAWADIYLLSFSDVLITSGQSTFGYVAQGLGGLKPWIMEKLDNSFKDPPCIQGLSMEPCFHFPPKFNCITKEPPSNYGCSADTSFDIKTLFPFMKTCEDLCWGVKMVNDH